MTDEQDRAESLDDDVIADDEDVVLDEDRAAGDDRFERIPALDEDYPPDRPMGVEDDGRFEIEDDIATRDSRGPENDE